MASIRHLTLLALVTPTLCAIFRRQNGNKHEVITDAPDKLPFQTDLPGQTIQNTGVGVTISGKKQSVMIQVFGADSGSFNTPDAQVPEETSPTAVPQAANAPANADEELDSEAIVGLIAEQLAAQAAAEPKQDDASDFVVSDSERDDEFPKQDDKTSGLLSHRSLSLRDLHNKLVEVFDRLKNGVEKKTNIKTWTRGQQETNEPEDDFYGQQENGFDGGDDDEDYHDEDSFDEEGYASGAFADADFDDAEFFSIDEEIDF